MTSHPTDAGPPEPESSEMETGAAEPDRSDESAPPGHPSPGTGVGRLLVSLPDRMLTAFLVLSVAVSLPLLVDQFRPWIVLPLIVVSLVLTRRWVPPTPRADRAAVIGTAIVIAIAVIWCVLNVPLYAEIMGVSRDPGQYTLFGMYLIDHPNGLIHLSDAVTGLASSVPGVSSDWNGRDVASEVPVQGTSLVPALIGMLGWFLGPVGALKALVVVGGLCLIGMYATARRLLGPLWGLLPVLALAVAMPLAGFSRVPYTEPASLLFFCGTLVLLWTGVERRSNWLMLLAGLFAGASVMARIDGVLALIGGVIGLGLVHVMATDPARRAESKTWLLRFMAGGAITGLIGVADLLLHSIFYVGDQAIRIGPLVLMVPILYFLARLLARWMPIRRLADVAMRRPRAFAGWLVAGVAVILLVLASRPWWLVSRLMYDDYQRAVAGRQQLENLPVDGAHSYDEWTVNWHAWYFGWAIVVAGGIGLLILVYRTVIRRDVRLTVFIAVPAAAAALYLNMASITPDQIWAMRRMLPGVIPGLLLVAAAGFQEVARSGATMLGAVLRRRVEPESVRWWRPAVATAAAMVFALPVTMWGSLFSVREGAGEYAFTQAICGQVPEGERLVIAGPNPAFGHFLPTAQQVCGLDAVRVKDPNREVLARVAQAWKDAPVHVVAFDQDKVDWTGGSGTEVAHVSYQRWEEKLMRSPIQPAEYGSTAWMGTLNADGTVTPAGQATAFPGS